MTDIYGDAVYKYLDDLDRDFVSNSERLDNFLEKYDDKILAVISMRIEEKFPLIVKNLSGGDISLASARNE